MKQLIVALSLFMALGTTNANAQAFELPKNVTPESMIHTLMECRAFYMVGAEAAKQTPDLQNKEQMSQKLTDIADNFLQFAALTAKQNEITTTVLGRLQRMKIESVLNKVKQKTYPVVMNEYKDSCAMIQKSMVSSLQKYAK